ncbi:type II secretion system F family protein [Nocardioides sp. SR21]|uniref:type II secretion system F family protein n=1 Tax=Nocardioides sp. SR21 TaxID=2919501 RepID=UPI001FA99A93|nr:type II secretion system F family protein [Nocardioides sp. SR21]
MTTWVAVLGAAVAAALAVPVRPGLRTTVPPSAAESAAASTGWLHRFRWWWCGLAGLGALVFVGGRAGPLVAIAAAAGAWAVIGRAEPTEVRRRREAVRRDLPHVVELFAATLRSGAAPDAGIGLVCAALPGPATERLSGVAARLELGLDPVQVWSGLADDPQLGRLGRALARAQQTGAPVVAAVERLADDLARAARAETEDRARAVGVKAAVPLGLCLLPAFVLIGIVPLVVALLTGLEL